MRAASVRFRYANAYQKGACLVQIDSSEHRKYSQLQLNYPKKGYQIPNKSVFCAVLVTVFSLATGLKFPKKSVDGFLLQQHPKVFAKNLQSDRIDQ